MELPKIIELSTIVFLGLIVLYIIINFMIARFKKNKKGIISQTRELSGGVVKPKAVSGQHRITSKKKTTEKINGSNRMKIIK